MRGRRFILFAATAALTVLFLIACGGAATGALRPIGQPVAGGAANGNPTSGGTTEEKPAQATGNQNEPALTDSAYIVREGSLDVEVKDLQSTVNQAQALVTGYGGYISGSKESNDGDNSYAAITYRFPVEHWYEALGALRGLGTKVISENTDAKDVTADVVDQDARLANLRSAETQYQQIMARAQTIDDVLKVQKQLDDTRGQIEQLQAQRDNLANRATLATLTVTWQVPTTATASVNEGWDLGREVDRAFAALVGFGQSLATLLIWLAIAVMPIVLPTAIVAFIAYRLIRRRSNRVTMEEPPAAEA